MAHLRGCIDVVARKKKKNQSNSFRQIEWIKCCFQWISCDLVFSILRRRAFTTDRRSEKKKRRCRKYQKKHLSTSFYFSSETKTKKTKEKKSVWMTNGRKKKDDRFDQNYFTVLNIAIEHDDQLICCRHRFIGHIYRWLLVPLFAFHSGRRRRRPVNFESAEYFPFPSLLAQLVLLPVQSETKKGNEKRERERRGNLSLV